MGSFGDLEQVKGVRLTKECPPNPKYRQYSYCLNDILIFNGLKLQKLTCRTPGYSLAYTKKRNRNWQALVGFYPAENYSVGAFLQQLKDFTSITCGQSEDRQYY